MPSEYTVSSVFFYFTNKNVALDCLEKVIALIDHNAMLLDFKTIYAIVFVVKDMFELIVVM